MSSLEMPNLRAPGVLRGYRGRPPTATTKLVEVTVLICLCYVDVCVCVCVCVRVCVSVCCRISE